MKYPPKIVALLQSIGVVIYVVLFATTTQVFQTYIPDPDVNPVFGITIFLLVFIVSALINGSLVLLYPAILYLEGKKKEALHILFFSCIYLIVFLLAIVGAIIFIS